MTATSTSPAYTAGPWFVSNGFDGERVIHGQGTEEYVCSTNPEDECQLANARLIAAAPELLEHLQNIVGMARSVSANWESGDLAAAVRNLDRIATAADVAIAKAEGRD